LGVVCDVTDAAAVVAAFEHVVARFGGVDIVVSNAGAAWQGRIGEVSDTVLRESFELNFFAHQSVARQAVKIMLAQGTGGCLLFNVSKQALNPGRRFRPLRAAQSRDTGADAAIRARLRRQGIRANAVNADRIRGGLLTPR
jgi:NAD(P)-dependent dehydrogenase (short-subunit alcohol dehydrogenase family)